MRRRSVCILAGLVLAATCLGAPAAPVTDPDETPQAGQAVILGVTGVWRCHFALKPPVMRTAGGIEPLTLNSRLTTHAKWLMFDTPMPPADWMQPAFDDSAWQRMPVVDPDSPWVGHLALRGRFRVDDPAKATGLKLSVHYRGGVVVWLNGEEIARGHVKPPAVRSGTGGAGPDALADDYAEGKHRDVRVLEDVSLPTSKLRRGTNVLAIAVHRSATPASAIKQVARNDTIEGGTCGVVKVRLTAPAGSAVTPNVTRPGGLQVWNSSAVASDFDVEFGDPLETVGPVRIVAPRGGTGSGKVVVGCDQPIKGLVAAAGDLVMKTGPRIPASKVLVRYAMPTSGEAGANQTYTVNPARFDALEEAPPEEVPVRAHQQSWRGRKVDDEPASVFGAVCPVWVTVNVPPDAPAGDYAGELIIRTEGEKRFAV
ncbi:MAG TPA: hypothetical protein VMX57_08300, partial [Planctomycetota bacterium]|nr:hypothetical protein [Planctomycetota bacterium]